MSLAPSLGLSESDDFSVGTETREAFETVDIMYSLSDSIGFYNNLPLPEESSELVSSISSGSLVTSDAREFMVNCCCTIRGNSTKPALGDAARRIIFKFNSFSSGIASVRGPV